MPLTTTVGLFHMLNLSRHQSGTQKRLYIVTCYQRYTCSFCMQWNSNPQTSDPESNQHTTSYAKWWGWGSLIFSLKSRKSTNSISCLKLITRSQYHFICSSSNAFSPCSIRRINWCQGQFTFACPHISLSAVWVLMSITLQSGVALILKSKSNNWSITMALFLSHSIDPCAYSNITIIRINWVHSGYGCFTYLTAFWKLLV